MAETGPIPRKRRTRQHVIADLSVNYVGRFILEEGHTFRSLEHDYGYDLELLTYDELGYVEPGLAYLQLKATETLEGLGGDYAFDLDIRDYNLWMLEPMPVFLVLFDAARKKAYWLYVQRYFEVGALHRPRKGAKTVRVRVPRRQAVTHHAIQQLRAYKQQVTEDLKRKVKHV